MQLCSISDLDQLGLHQQETDSCVEELSVANSSVSTAVPGFESSKIHDATLTKKVVSEQVLDKVKEPGAQVDTILTMPVQAEPSAMIVCPTPPAEEQLPAAQRADGFSQELLVIQGRWETDRVGSLEVIGDMVRYDKLPNISYRIVIDGGHLVLDRWRTEAPRPWGSAPHSLRWEFERIPVGGLLGSVERTKEYICWTRKASPVAGLGLPAAALLHSPPLAAPYSLAVNNWPFAHIQGQWETTSFGSVVVEGEYAKFSMTPAPGILLRFDPSSNKLTLQEWSAEVSQIGQPGFRLIRWTARSGSELRRVTWHRSPGTIAASAPSAGAVLAGRATRVRKPPSRQEARLPPRTPRPRRPAASAARTTTKEVNDPEVKPPRPRSNRLDSTRQGPVKRRQAHRPTDESDASHDEAESAKEEELAALRCELEAKIAELEEQKRKSIPTVVVAPAKNAKKKRRKGAPASDDDAEAGDEERRRRPVKKRTGAEAKKEPPVQPSPPKVEPLTREAKADLQRKLDALDDDQLDEVLEFLKPELGSAEGEELNLELNKLKPERQIALFAMVNRLLSKAQLPITSMPAATSLPGAPMASTTMATCIPAATEAQAPTASTTMAMSISAAPTASTTMAMSIPAATEAQAPTASTTMAMSISAAARADFSRSLDSESMLNCADEVLSMMEGIA